MWRNFSFSVGVARRAGKHGHLVPAPLQALGVDRNDPRPAAQVGPAHKKRYPHKSLYSLVTYPLDVQCLSYTPAAFVKVAPEGEAAGGAEGGAGADHGIVHRFSQRRRSVLEKLLQLQEVLFVQMPAQPSPPRATRPSRAGSAQRRPGRTNAEPSPACRPEQHARARAAAARAARTGRNCICQGTAGAAKLKNRPVRRSRRRRHDRPDEHGREETGPAGKNRPYSPDESV